MKSGRYVRGEVSSADASAGVAATLYGIDGNSITLAPNERVVITNASIINVAAGIAFLTTSANSAGKRLLGGTRAANSQTIGEWAQGVYCEVATPPKVFAAAGQVDCQFIGFIDFAAIAPS